MNFMRLRSALAAVFVLLLAAPATASADGFLGAFTNVIEGSQRPVPGGRGEVGFRESENPCGNNQLTNQQSGYFGRTIAAESWGQIGRPPRLLPPGTFWETSDEEGFVPTDPNAESIPPSVTRVPSDAARITTTRWTAAPSAGRLVPYQPRTTLACSVVYRLRYGSFGPIGLQSGQPTAVCRDANDSTPFVQWIQSLEKSTPALFSGIETDKVLVQALRDALKSGATKSAKTIVVNTFKELWGGKPSTVLGAGLAQNLLETAVSSYINSLAKQAEPMSNAVWDYYVDAGRKWTYWSPAQSRMEAGKLEVALVSSDPSTDWAAISVACSSTPTLQGGVLDLRPRRDGSSLRLSVHGPSYYGTSLPTDKGVVGAPSARASTATASTATDDESGAEDETVIDTGKDGVNVDAGPGNDVVFGSRGEDVLRGGSGEDKLIGGPGSDQLIGGPGEDLLVDHSAAADVFSGGAGTDRIDARSGGAGRPDTISCGAGDDIVLADPGDQIAADCEHVFFSLGEAPHELDDALGEPPNWPR